jgi:hypothetical protein
MKNIQSTDCTNKNCQGGVINGASPRLCRKCNPQEAINQDDENYLDSFGVAKAEFEVFRNFTTQQTLEEAAQNYLSRVADGKRTTGYADGDFIKGAKWQAERMYSEEEVIRIIQECKSYLSFGDEFDEMTWFKQHKKIKR